MATKASAINLGMSVAIRAERSARGVTITQLSQRSGIPVPTLNRLIAKNPKDLRDINVTQMAQIADALGMSVEELVAEAKRRAPHAAVEDSSQNEGVSEHNNTPDHRADDLAAARRRRKQAEAAGMTVEEIESLADAAARRREPEIDNDQGEDE